MTPFQVPLGRATWQTCPLLLLSKKKKSQKGNDASTLSGTLMKAVELWMIFFSFVLFASSCNVPLFLCGWGRGSEASWSQEGPGPGCWPGVHCLSQPFRLNSLHTPFILIRDCCVGSWACWHLWPGIRVSPPPAPRALLGAPGAWLRAEGRDQEEQRGRGRANSGQMPRPLCRDPVCESEGFRLGNTGRTVPGAQAALEAWAPLCVGDLLPWAGEALHRASFDRDRSRALSPPCWWGVVRCHLWGALPKPCTWTSWRGAIAFPKKPHLSVHQ